MLVEIIPKLNPTDDIMKAANSTYLNLQLYILLKDSYFSIK